MSVTAKLTAKCQITIPAATRRQLGLQPGDRVHVEVVDGAMVLRPVHGGFVDDLVGLGREVWAAEGGADAYLDRQRSEWESW